MGDLRIQMTNLEKLNLPDGIESKITASIFKLVDELEKSLNYILLIEFSSEFLIILESDSRNWQKSSLKVFLLICKQHFEKITLFLFTYLTNLIILILCFLFDLLFGSEFVFSRAYWLSLFDTFTHFFSYFLLKF